MNFLLWYVYAHDLKWLLYQTIALTRHTFINLFHVKNPTHPHYVSRFSRGGEKIQRLLRKTCSIWHHCCFLRSPCLDFVSLCLRIIVFVTYSLHGLVIFFSAHYCDCPRAHTHIQIQLLRRFLFFDEFHTWQTLVNGVGRYSILMPDSLFWR